MLILEINQGRDSCGAFSIVIPGFCSCCGKASEATVSYKSWTSKVPIAATILGARRHSLGIPCGCYAKLCRQVAHILDKWDRGE